MGLYPERQHHSISLQLFSLAFQVDCSCCPFPVLCLSVFSCWQSRAGELGEGAPRLMRCCPDASLYVVACWARETFPACNRYLSLPQIIRCNEKIKKEQSFTKAFPSFLYSTFLQHAAPHFRSSHNETRPSPRSTRGII